MAIHISKPENNVIRTAYKINTTKDQGPGIFMTHAGRDMNDPVLSDPIHNKLIKKNSL